MAQGGRTSSGSIPLNALNGPPLFADRDDDNHVTPDDPYEDSDDESVTFDSLAEEQQVDDPNPEGRFRMCFNFSRNQFRNLLAAWSTLRYKVIILFLCFEVNTTPSLV
jgi:hypothetical protein